MDTEFFQVEVIKETWNALTGSRSIMSKTVDKYPSKFFARDAYFDKYNYYEKRKKIKAIDNGQEVVYEKEDKKYWHIEKLYGYEKGYEIIGVTVRMAYYADEWTGLSVDEECRQSRTRFNRLYTSFVTTHKEKKEEE